MTDAESYAITPRQYAALWHRWELENDRPYAANSTLTAAFLNVHREKGAAPVSPLDLIPTTLRDKPKRDREFRRRRQEENIAALREEQARRRKR